MKIIVKMKNQKGNNEYNATAEYSEKGIKVLKGSKINSKVASSNRFKLNSIATEARKNDEYVSKDGLVLKDIEFASASTAGQFVCGYSVSGMICWRTEDKKTLGEIVKGRK